MKFSNINEELEYSNKRYELKNEIEKILLEKNYQNYESNIIEDYYENSHKKDLSKNIETIKIIGDNGKIVLLNRDITTNILNKLIPNWEAEKEVKLFYYGKIFKRDNSKIREIRQMGAEYIGTENIESDIEIISLLLEIIGRYRNKYILEIGTSEYLKGILNELYLNDNEYKIIIKLIRNKNKEDLYKFLEKFEDSEVKKALNNLIDMRGNFKNVLHMASKYCINDKMKKGLEELKEVNKYIEKIDVKRENIIWDLSIISSLNYYSGIMFKGFYEDSNKEIIKGGRYNINYDEYGEVIPAIGFSIEIDELLKNIYSKGEI